MPIKLKNIVIKLIKSIQNDFGEINICTKGIQDLKKM